MAQQINLFQPVTVEREDRPTLLQVVLAAAAVLVLMSGLITMHTMALHKLQAQQRDLDGQLADWRDKLTKLPALYAGKTHESPEQQIETLSDLLAAHQQVLLVLQDGSMGSRDGYSKYMEAFARQVVSGLWLTSFDISESGKAIMVNGRMTEADLLPRYVERLNHEPTLDGVNFAALDIDEVSSTAKLPGEHGKFKYFEFGISSFADDKGRPVFKDVADAGSSHKEDGR